MKPPVQTIVTAAADTWPAFRSAGFTLPRNLVRVDGKPVLARAVSSYAIDSASTVVAVQRSEDAEFRTADVLQTFNPKARVMLVDQALQGALLTALMSLSDLDDDLPLVVVGGDSEVTIPVAPIIEEWLEAGVEAATLTFASSSPRWSYARVGLSGDVREVAEKRCISKHATTGLFYFHSLRRFVDAATWCLVNNARVEGRFFVSTALNYVIQSGERVVMTEIPPDAYRSWSFPVDFISSEVTG